MKRFFATILAVSMLGGMLGGCGESPAKQNSDVNADNVQQEQPKNPTVYPDGAEVIIDDTDKITAPPAAVYTTPAEENGLGDTMYKFVGTVEKHVSAENSESGVEYIIVDTGEGKASIVSPVQSIMGTAGEMKIDEQKLQAFFKFPDEGEYVCVYALYQGYSDLLECASAVLGGEYYMGYALGKVLMPSSGDQASTGSTDAETKTESPKEPVKTETPKEPAKTQTMGQKNALSSAKNYLSIMAFSHSGLIDQLKYDDFSTEDATYAADNCGADWNEQAAKSAKNYLDIMSFSRSGLIDQLKYDGFTQEQAEYGATAAGY